MEEPLEPRESTGTIATPVDTITASIPSPSHESKEKRSHFLELPTELRLSIWEFVLKQIQILPSSLFITDKVYVWGQFLPTDIHNCLCLCKQINRELNDII